MVYSGNMDTLMKANIFFFITTIAVLVFLVLGSVMFVYIIRILRNIKRASDALEAQVEHLGEHADVLYHDIRESFLFHLLFGKKHKKRVQ